MKFINELTEKQRKKLIKDVQLHIFTDMKCLFTVAEQYDFNEEELFDVWRYLEEKCFKEFQSQKVTGFTVDEAMKMLMINDNDLIKAIYEQQAEDYKSCKLLYFDDGSTAIYKAKKSEKDKFIETIENMSKGAGNDG